jgi:hypothetical protein
LFSIYAYGLREYDFLFSVIDQNILDQYRGSRPIIVINSLIDQYMNAIRKNSKQNNDRVHLIDIAQGLLLTGITLIAIPVGLMLFN